MSITVEKRGNQLIVLNADEPIAENETIVLFTEKEIAKKLGYTPLEFAQLESIFRESEEDWGDSLDAMTLPMNEVPNIETDEPAGT